MIEEMYGIKVGDRNKGDNEKDIELSKSEWKSIYDSLNDLFPEFSQADDNFYEDIVKSLREEANKLSGKLTLYNNKVDMNLYIATVKSLRETLELISKYDWRLMYSEYGLYSDETKQVAVWEQNHDNQIRNHKVWNVVEALKLTSDITKEAGNKIGDALKSVSENL